MCCADSALPDAGKKHRGEDDRKLQGANETRLRAVGATLDKGSLSARCFFMARRLQRDRN